MPATDTRRTAVLPGVPESVGEARALVREALGDCPATDAATLCASELITNSVLYTRSGRPGGTVPAGRRPAPGAAPPPVPAPGAGAPRATAAGRVDAGEGGFGLRIVEQ